ncbi:hypothetical protein BG20_I0507 [Candidatus Nitrosarchaeum limnium BG20]|uniref:Uncharacterized protein n=1 Tax=Candidatus Nitrosarchaeum limnium BG20 TaxID=859192 RepID=S2E0G8_9ARCH|nr:hypothetical protein BG20_I0507 [Candidatus Nitrosarchaeum limnium BG20]
MKLKKLHKMGDVGNTILKYLENEKNHFGQNQIYFFSKFYSNFYFFLNYQNKNYFEVRSSNLHHVMASNQMKY